MNTYNFARRMKGLNENVIREIFKFTQLPDIISFAGGLPAADSFPVDELKKISAKVFEKMGSQVLQYGITEGYNPLRDFIVSWVQRYKIDTIGENVLILSGSSQGIDLVAKSFINPRDYVAVEEPSFLSAIQTFRGYEANIMPLKTDEYGLVLDGLEEKLQKYKPKLLYIIPHFQNPTGVTLSYERRKRLMEIISKTDVIVIEDDPYVELRYYTDLAFNGERLPALKAYDDNNQVIYLGSFSKIVAPGLRVGYAIADKQILQKMIICKQANDLHTSNLSQAIVYEFATTGLLKHIKKINADYCVKRDHMLNMLDKYMKGKAYWTKPDGGLFIWLTLPKGMNSQNLLEKAVEKKVAFIPGFPFYARQHEGENTMRLNFSNGSVKQIEEGIKRLSEIM